MSRTYRSKIRNAPRSMAPSTQRPAINIQINVDAAPMTETDVEVTLRLEGKAESQGMLLFSFELAFAGIFRVAERAGRQHAAGRADRMPAPVVSIRARDHRHGDAQWRLSTAAA